VKIYYGSAEYNVQIQLERAKKPLRNVIYSNGILLKSAYTINMAGGVSVGTDW